MKKYLALLGLLLWPALSQADDIIIPPPGTVQTTSPDYCVDPGPMQIGNCTQADTEKLLVIRDPDGVAVATNPESMVILEDDGNTNIGFRTPNTTTKGFVFNEATDPDGAFAFWGYDGTTSRADFGFSGGQSTVTMLRNASGPLLSVGANARADLETFYVKAADDGVAVTSASSINAIIEDSSTNFLGFRTSNSAAQGIVFNAGTVPDANRFTSLYDGSNSRFTWRLGGFDWMTLLHHPTLTIGSTARADAETLYIKTSDDGIAVASDTTQKLIVENSTGTFIGFRYGTNQTAGLKFNAGTDPDANQFSASYDGASSQFFWGLDGTTRLRLFPTDLAWSDAAAAQTANIRMGTSDADDDARLCLTGGGLCGNTARGAYIQLNGNEFSSGGDININSGAASGSDVAISANATNGTVTVTTNSVLGAVFESDGDFALQVISAGIVLRSPDGSFSKCTIDNSDVLSCTGI